MEPPRDSQQKTLWTPEFRRKCWQYLKTEGIPDKEHAYYGLRLRQFTREAGITRLDEITNVDANRAISSLTAQPALSAWQRGQLIDAVHIFYRRVFKVDRASHCDWQWLQSTIPVKNTVNATTAREYTPEEQVYISQKIR